jgi:uncharacterized protein (TIGR03083 family)
VGGTAPTPAPCCLALLGSTALPHGATVRAAGAQDRPLGAGHHRGATSAPTRKVGVLDASSISTVLDVLRPERGALVDLLRGLTAEEWARPTECPAYPVHGVAAHILGDDLSLLSRQRDSAPNGLIFTAETLPGADFRTLLDAFNDRWVDTTRFVSTELLVTLLELAGEWTASFYEEVDPESPGEPVGFFGPGPDGTSPYWHAIAREYVERWVHHSQIRRAVGLGSVDDPRFVGPGVAVIGAALRWEVTPPASEGGPWTLGDVTLGPSSQAATILTRGLTAGEVQPLLEGPPDAVALLAAVAGRT